jgi:diaminopimelate dehydrogenase
MSKIKIGIVGYGNLGKGVEMAMKQNADMELVGVFTRRSPKNVQIATPGVSAYSIEDAKDFKEKIDVMILCGGSATDLPVQSPEFGRMFNIIDSFDTHAKIPEHFNAVDEACKSSHKLGIISVGWDPGLFSINRIYAETILPVGTTYTFWGKGVSQGHSDAIRRVEGVKKAIQYTVPVDEAMDQVRACHNPELTTRQKHTRECYVVAEAGADLEKIESEIVEMPNYFSDYDTTVVFMSEEEFDKTHNNMPHGGFVMRSGKTGANEETNQMIEYSLKLESNPEFTSSVLVAYARAAYRLQKEGISGCKTVFDIAPSYLSIKGGAELRKELL